MVWDWVTVGVGLLVILTGGLVVLVAWLLWRDGFIRGWRAARRDPPKCVGCGYNLSGLTACRCPECGREHRLEELWRGAAAGPRRNAGSQPGGSTTSRKSH